MEKSFLLVFWPDGRTGRQDDEMRTLPVGVGSWRMTVCRRKLLGISVNWEMIDGFIDGLLGVWCCWNCVGWILRNLVGDGWCGASLFGRWHIIPIGKNIQIVVNLLGFMIIFQTQVIAKNTPLISLLRLAWACVASLAWQFYFRPFWPDLSFLTSEDNKDIVWHLRSSCKATVHEL